ncbi:asparagine synthase (glutamine-hydrolyzing) [Cryomorphaceae bacterium 1068]|nr:asparagine synthase (glutamine-hydrolyzing) [Cryomorphaceae bacterium 1068]
MCGIAGIYGHTNSDSAQLRIRKMADKLKHRGPNAEGFHVSDGIALAHRRLSIIDLSDGANQPMTDASGRYTIVFNGEIYNFRELKKQLSGYSFQTDGDTEVLLAGLAKWGISFVNECNGMFAFALWDNQEEELFLCRDRMGIKPLYYLRKDNEILFSSEVRSLISGLNSKPNLNSAALAEYLRYQTVHGPATILEGVFSLPAGSYMKITDNEQEIKYYWKLAESARTDMRGMSYEDTYAAVRASLDASVKRRLIADVPLGVFLSGGIDSSAVVALAAKHSISPIKTFNIDFQEQEFSEAKYAEEVARKFGTEHHRIQLAPNELINQLPAALSAMDHPSGDGINAYVVSGAAKSQGITVALSGLGGDELFAGYPIFKQFRSLQNKKWLLSFPKFARDLAGSLLEMRNPGVASSKTRSVLNQDRFDLEYIYPFSREVATIGQNADMLAIASQGESSVYNLVKRGVGYGNPGFSLPILSHVSYAELTTYLENILLRDTDQMSMAHALEVRVPFLDHELVSMVMGIGDRHKFPYSPKKLLVDAMGDDLPDSIVNRPKMGFTFPWEVWMRNELKEFCGEALQKLGARDAFNSKAIDKRWNGFLKGDSKISWSRIWHLCILEAWLDENEI